MIGISWSLIWSKTLISGPCDEFRWSPEDPVSQIYSPQLHIGAPEIFEGLFRRERENGFRKETGNYFVYSIPAKTAALVPEFAVDDLPSAELQPMFLHLQWRTYSWSEYCDDNIFKWVIFSTSLYNYVTIFTCELTSTDALKSRGTVIYVKCNLECVLFTGGVVIKASDYHSEGPGVESRSF